LVGEACNWKKIGQNLGTTLGMFGFDFLLLFDGETQETQRDFTDFHIVTSTRAKLLY
jgi:hypothetical protein